jgi:hypothetical protein
VTQLTAANCYAAPAGTAPELLGRYYSIRPASNWTKTGNYQRTETLLLELTAPQAPAQIQFHSDLGPVHTVYGAGASAHGIAQQHAASLPREYSPQAVAGAVSDCSVGSEPAAAFGFSEGNSSGYRLYFVHGDLLFEIVLVGVGGVSNHLINDSLGMIGSVKWAF